MALMQILVHKLTATHSVHVHIHTPVLFTWRLIRKQMRHGCIYGRVVHENYSLEVRAREFVSLKVHINEALINLFNEKKI